MAENSPIEWTDHTWSPITGCTLLSDGCRNCYAAELAAGRLQHHPSRAGLARRNAQGVAKFTGEVRFNEQWLDEPLRWRKPRMIFVCAHGDLFHDSVPDDWIDRVFAVMALAPQHTFQVLTKRPERARNYLSNRETIERLEGLAISELAPTPIPLTLPLPNVWLGVSVEDQATVDARIPPLLDTPAAVRFISAEPLLGPVDLTRIDLAPQVRGSIRAGIHLNALAGKYVEGGMPYIGDWDVRGPCPADAKKRTLDWVIVGGESGRNARPMHPDWVRSLRDQCADAHVPFFFKQWGEWTEACSNWCEEDGSQVEVDPDSEEAESLWDGGTDTLIAHNGHRYSPATLPGDTRAQLVTRVGKKAAGRTLDGVVHDGFPEVRP